MATFVIGLKVVRDSNNNPIEFTKQYYTYMSRYDSFLRDDKLAVEFKTIESALSWWNNYKVRYPERIIQAMEYADPETLSIRQRRTTYKLTEKLTM